MWSVVLLLLLMLLLLLPHPKPKTLNHLRVSIPVAGVWAATSGFRSGVHYDSSVASRLQVLKAHFSRDRTENIWGFSKIRGTILGVPIIRTIVFWGVYWGPFNLGNYHLG